MPPVFNAEQGGHFACTVRTDSRGAVYAFFNHFAFGFPGRGTHTMVKSLNGGLTWTPPREIVDQNDACYAADFLAPFSCVMDGFLGVRIDVTSAPSVDIANGAPSGEDATNELVDVWGDGRFGFNKEVALLSYPTDAGNTWSNPSGLPARRPRVILRGRNRSRRQPPLRGLHGVHGALPGDDGESQTGARGACVEPGRSQRGTVRVEHRAMKRPRATPAEAAASDSAGSSWAITSTLSRPVPTEPERGPTARSANCTAVDQWRQKSLDAGVRVFPAPWPIAACPNNFGNVKIFSVTTGKGGSRTRKV